VIEELDPGLIDTKTTGSFKNLNYGFILTYLQDPSLSPLVVRGNNLNKLLNFTAEYFLLSALKQPKGRTPERLF